MIGQKNEYQKFDDDAVRNRAMEEGLGRLRMGVFWAVVGALGAGACKVLDFKPPQWLAIAIVGSAPLAILLLIINFIRLPAAVKTSTTALLIGFMTLIGAGGTTFLARIFGILELVSP